jgi:hypothetical protein
MSMLVLIVYPEIGITVNIICSRKSACGGANTLVWKDVLISRNK